MRLYQANRLAEELKTSDRDPLPVRNAVRKSMKKWAGRVFEDLQMDDEISLGSEGAEVEFFSLGPNPDRDWMPYAESLFQKFHHLVLPPQRAVKRPREEIDVDSDEVQDTIASRVTRWRTPSARRTAPPRIANPVILGIYQGVAYTTLEELQHLIRLGHQTTAEPVDWVVQEETQVMEYEDPQQADYYVDTVGIRGTLVNQDLYIPEAMPPVVNGYAENQEVTVEHRWSYPEGFDPAPFGGMLSLTFVRPNARRWRPAPDFGSAPNLQGH